MWGAQELWELSGHRLNLFEENFSNYSDSGPPDRRRNIRRISPMLSVPSPAFQNMQSSKTPPKHAGRPPTRKDYNKRLNRDRLARRSLDEDLHCSPQPHASFTPVVVVQIAAGKYVRVSWRAVDALATPFGYAENE